MAFKYIDDGVMGWVDQSNLLSFSQRQSFLFFAEEAEARVIETSLFW